MIAPSKRARLFLSAVSHELLFLSSQSLSNVTQRSNRSLRTGSFLLVGKFGAKRRASGACTQLPKSQLPPTRRTACQLSSFNQSARAESQNPQQTKNDTLGCSLVFSHGKIICGLKAETRNPEQLLQSCEAEKDM